MLNHFNLKVKSKITLKKIFLVENFKLIVRCALFGISFNL